jgi:phosphoribosylaminoimidazole carboxylase, catalytic subunit
VYHHGAGEPFYADRLGSLIRKKRIGLLFFINLKEDEMKKIGIVMGSDSDLPIVEKAIATVQEYGVECEVHVYSAHRTPEQAKEFACSAREKGFGVLIAAAGKAAHLAGAIAASTTLPVIGLPIKSSTLDGIDALLSTVQMPAGIPVATVAIDGAVNAALLSLQILAVEDVSLARKLEEARRTAAENVLARDAEISKKYH